jgi:hypothetical protein
MSKTKSDFKSVSELGKWLKNPRKITAEKARILFKTLKQFGDLGGIVFNKKNNSLVSGHQRSDALAQGEIVYTEKFSKPNKIGTVALGYIIFNDERFSYREVYWDEETHAAAAIAANKQAGEWDMAMLKERLVEIDTGALDMEMTGFPLPEVENLLTQEEWKSDIEALNKVVENLDGINATIKITCPQDLRDEVLIFIKGKLLETSFEGVHIE